MPSVSYYEDSLERAAYLFAHGVKPIGGSWVPPRESAHMGPTYRFQYAKSDKLGKLLMGYKGSKFDHMIGAFYMLYRAKGRYIKAHKYGLPQDVKDVDLHASLISYVPNYGK